MKLAFMAVAALLCAPQLVGDAASLRRAKQKSQAGTKRGRASMSAAAAATALATLSSAESAALARLAAKYDCNTNAKHLVVSLTVAKAANRQRSSELNTSCLGAQRELEADLASRLHDIDELENSAQAKLPNAAYASFEKAAQATYTAIEKEQNDLVAAANAAALASATARQEAMHAHDEAAGAHNLANALYENKVAALDEKVMVETNFLKKLRDGELETAEILHNESMALAMQRHAAAKLLCRVTYEHRMDIAVKDEGIIANEIMPLVAQLQLCQNGSQINNGSPGLRFVEVEEEVKAAVDKKKRCEAAKKAKKHLYGISMLQLKATAISSSTASFPSAVMEVCNELNARITSEKVDAGKARGHCIRENDGFFGAEARSFSHLLNTSKTAALQQYAVRIADLMNATLVEKRQRQESLVVGTRAVARAKGVLDSAKEVDEEDRAKADAAAHVREVRLASAQIDRAKALARGRATADQIEAELKADAATQRKSAQNDTDTKLRLKAAECSSQQQILAEEAELVEAIRAKIRTLTTVTDAGDAGLGIEVSEPAARYNETASAPSFITATTTAPVGGPATLAVTTASPVVATATTASLVVASPVVTTATTAAPRTSGFEVWRVDEHPRITTATDQGCINLPASAEHAACLTKCKEDPSCKEVWAYDNGRCCMKTKSTPSGGWRRISGGTYYRRK